MCRRVCRPAFSHDKAVAIIKAGRDKHFDPDMTDAFLEIAKDFMDTRNDPGEPAAAHAPVQHRQTP